MLFTAVVLRVVLLASLKIHCDIKLINLHSFSAVCEKNIVAALKEVIYSGMKEFHERNVSTPQVLQ